MPSGPRRHAWPALLAIAALGVVAALTQELASPEAAPAQRSDGFAYSYEFDDDVDRSSERDLIRAFEVAREKRATVLIVRLDTPGGAVTSMRRIVKAMIAAPVPVIVYVSPGGSHAGSAGLFLTLAADAAAMAPGTNIGSSTPVIFAPPGGGPAQEKLLRDLGRKLLNDTVAFARTLAEDHGHNADLAERMVREAANVSAATARRSGLIDVVAPNQRELLKRLDGFQVKGRKARKLETAGLAIKPLTLDEVRAPAPEELDRSSLLRSMAPILGVMGVVLLGLVVLANSSGFWRRRKWLYRRWRSNVRHRR